MKGEAIDNKANVQQVQLSALLNYPWNHAGSAAAS